MIDQQVPAITNEDDLGPRTRYSAVQHRHYAFKCPVPDACTGNTLAVVGNGYVWMLSALYIHAGA